MDLLSDPIVEWVRMDRLNAEHRDRPGWAKLTVLPKPGVMDPAALSVSASQAAMRRSRRQPAAANPPSGKPSCRT